VVLVQVLRAQLLDITTTFQTPSSDQGRLTFRHFQKYRKPTLDASRNDQETPMKRLHLHVTVPELAASIQFYETLFGQGPSVVKDDYAKWMLDDPKVNFAISTQASRNPGVDHVGIQVDSAAELGELAGRLKAAGATTFDEQATTCCYAKSDKSWVSDPAGVRWETFYTFGEATTYGTSEALKAMEAAAKPATACCGAPAAASAPEPVKENAKAGACC
jgi:catechol 2,3-dioxygenase-like lactoylglutathione lyase family enzyme